MNRPAAVRSFRGLAPPPRAENLGGMKRLLLLAWLTTSIFYCATAADKFPDRFVWIFGWGLGKDVVQITRVLETAGQHGRNGAVVSFGLDSLCKRDGVFFRRRNSVRQACEANHLELIRSVFSVGYGGGILSYDKNLAEGLPVTDALFLVQDREARFVPDTAARLSNGGFDEFPGHTFRGFGFHDQPGEVSFADANVTHSSRARLCWGRRACPRNDCWMRWPAITNTTRSRDGGFLTKARRWATTTIAPTRCWRCCSICSLMPAMRSKTMVAAASCARAAVRRCITSGWRAGLRA